MTTRRLLRIRTLLGIATVLSLAVAACSNETPSDPSTTGGGAAGGAADVNVNDDVASDTAISSDASSDAGLPNDASSDMSRPPPDAAADTSRPSDAGGDVGRPADAVIADKGAPDSSPPVNDAISDTNRVDTLVPDVIGPSDAGCDSTLTGVDLFRCQALNYGAPTPLLQDLTTTAGPRLAGSTGLATAITWAQAKMTALGLQNVHTEAVTVPHWERGDGHAELLGTTERPLAIAALGGSVATAAGGVEAEVIEVASVAALNALSNSQVQGKIVFINVVTQRAKDASGYGATTGARRTGASTAASKGAVASIVRSITPATNNSPHTGDMNSIPQIPAVAIGVADAIVLSDAIKAGPTRVRITLGCQTLASVQSANVIGEVVGQEKPDEIVLLGAHLDSWDLATGALDDGAGVAMIIEAARLLTVYAPDSRRTIRVVLFANEEFGLSGANAYSSAHQAELAKHVMATEADLGGDRVYGVTFQAGSAAATTLRDLYAPLGPLGVATATSGGDYGSDLGPLRRSGVPVTELQQDLTTYFDFHHSTDDTMDAVDPAALTQATAAMAVFAYQVGRSSADFGRAGLLPEGASERSH